MDRSFYRFVTIHACDRQTNGRTKTEFSSLDRVCMPRSAVKMLTGSGEKDCLTHLLGTLKSREWKSREKKKYGKRRFQKCVSDYID